MKVKFVQDTPISPSARCCHLAAASTSGALRIYCKSWREKRVCASPGHRDGVKGCEREASPPGTASINLPKKQKFGAVLSYQKSYGCLKARMWFASNIASKHRVGGWVGGKELARSEQDANKHQLMYSMVGWHTKSEEFDKLVCFISFSCVISVKVHCRWSW